MMEMPETQWATTVDGASIAYQDLGSAPLTVVLVNGFLSHVEVYWEYPATAAWFERLARNLRVLTFDKRGTGMSDGMPGAPSLDVQMDDVRAVIDAAHVERAAIVTIGNPGPALAAFFAATYPQRTLALWIDGDVSLAATGEYPGSPITDDDARLLRRLESAWGQERTAVEFAHFCTDYADGPGDAPYEDPAFLKWMSKMARYSATPSSVGTFMDMWMRTDVRSVLPMISVPTAIAYHDGWPYKERETAHYLSTQIPGAQLVECGRDWMLNRDRYVRAVETFLGSIVDEEKALDRVLTTVLFTDIVGSTHRVCELGDRTWTERLERHNQILRALLTRYRGVEVKTTGDGLLATFDGPARAVKCAQAICQAMKPLGLEVRAGCHTGEIELLGADIGGIAVHIAARVAALAGPSEVLVSSTVKDLVAGSGLVFEDRGEHALKGVPESWRLYSVTA
jgi:class 3 adenylate cyclase